MRVSFKSIIDLTMQTPKPDFHRLYSQIASTGLRHAPIDEDVRAAVNTGSPLVVEALIESKKLTEKERKDLATSGLHAWASNPLASRQAPEIVRTLIKHGAEPLKGDAQGMSVLDKTGPMLDRMRAEEAKLKSNPKARVSSPMTSTLLLERCMDTIRKSLGPDKPINIDGWREGRVRQGPGTVVPSLQSRRGPSV